MGLFGAALICGVGAITHAISVLSAIEGVEQIEPTLRTYVLPAAIVILLALFAVQPFGTAAIGRAFGSIMLAWFLIIAALGVCGIRGCQSNCGRLRMADTSSRRAAAYAASARHSANAAERLCL